MKCYKKIDITIPPEDIAIIQKEAEDLYNRGYYIMREVSPPSMYGVALYSVDNHVLNAYWRYNDPNIDQKNADWTEASHHTPTLVKYLKQVPLTWNRITLWNMQKGYKQGWHTESGIAAIIHLVIKKPHDSTKTGCCWKLDSGDVVYEDWKEGEFYYFNPNISHDAINTTDDHRYQLIAFSDDVPSDIFD
jgi:hypothetical protein